MHAWLVQLETIDILLLFPRVIGTGKESLLKLAACSAVLLGFFVYHVHYLAFVRFDYGYNMAATVTVGKIRNLMISTNIVEFIVKHFVLFKVFNP